jgi:hypothetical protein
MTASPSDAASDSDSDGDLRREGDRIAQLVDDLGTIGGAPVRQRVEELVQRLMHIYGTGFARLLQILTPEAGEPRADDARRARLHADPLVSSLLVPTACTPIPTPPATSIRARRPRRAPRPAAPSGRRSHQIDLARSRAPTPGGGSRP